jgi:cell division protease FtsH
MMQELLMKPHIAGISYSQFRDLVAQKKVKDLVITKEYITGKVEKSVLSTDQPLKEAEEGWHNFTTTRVEDPELIQDLRANGIEFKGKIQSNWLGSVLAWVIPFALFFWIWGLLMKKMGGGMQQNLMSIGKSKAKVYVQDATRVTFEDVAGIDEAKEELLEVVEFLKTPEKFVRLGGKIPKGVLLVGPPGTGKTLLAKAAAGEAGVPFFSMNGSEFVEMFVGVGAARVRDLFHQASQKAPCIIFIDELDALGKARGLNPLGGHDEREQTLNQLLVELDGFETNKGVIIMGATNRPETLDQALLRPGRFDRQILVDRPDINGREAILKVHVRGVKLAANVNLRTVAARTPGFVGADLANLVNEAALLASRKNRDEVTMADFEDAIDRIIGGLEKKTRIMNPKEKERVAYHETGHAVVAESLPNADPVHKISIIPRGVAALGYTLQLPTEDSYLLTKSELLDRLAVLLGGRAAEEVIFGEISTGAQNDLQRATDIARSMVKEYGMSEQLGPVFLEPARRGLFLNTDFGAEQQYSEETARFIDQEVKRIIFETYDQVKKILQKKKKALKQVAQILLQKEVIQGEELRRIIAENGKVKNAK